MEKIREIAIALSRTTDPDLISDFLTCLLTPAEIAEISARWELVRMLEQGVSQRRIAGELGISLCKITRGSRELKKKESAFKTMLQICSQTSPQTPVRPSATKRKARIAKK